MSEETTPETVDVDVDMYEKVGRDVLTVVEKALIAHANSRAGALREVDIRDVIESLRNAPGLLPNLFQGLVKPGQVMRFKRDPFTRILVSYFSNLFGYEPKRSLAEGALSRRMLPGFFVAVRLMIGGKTYDSYREQCDEQLAEMRQKYPGPDDAAFWERLYRSEQAQEIAAKVYARIGLYFTKYDRRKTWFVDMVNSNLKPIGRGEEDTDEARWWFEENHFTELFSTVFLPDPRSSKLRPSWIKAMKAVDNEAAIHAKPFLQGLVKDIKTYL